jgi:ankyrin repeat protein
MPRSYRWLWSFFMATLLAQEHGSNTGKPPQLDLRTAVMLGDLASTRRLLAGGGDPNALTDGAPLWLSALSTGQKSIFYALSARILIAPSPEDSKTQIGADALAIAAGRGYPDVAEFLLDRGLDVNARRFVGTTATLIAAANGEKEVLTVLFRRNPNVNIADQHGDTPLMAAVRAGSLPIVQALLAKGADTNARDKNGRTAVWWAARTDRTDILDALVRRSANLNIADEHGSTPLMQAGRFGRMDMIEALRANGTRGHARVEERRSLTAAIRTSLPLIQTRAVMWIDKTKCGSCHHTMPALHVTALAKRYGFELNEELMARLRKHFRDGVVRRGERALKSSSTREASAGTGAPYAQEDRSFSAVGESMLALTDASLDQTAGNIALLLSNLQFDDGRWIHGLGRFPIESSDLLTTAYAIRALQRYAPAGSRARIDGQIARAAAWLKAAPVQTTDDLRGKLYGLYWTDKRSPEFRRVAQQLLRAQRSDGSWPQAAGMNGDAYATGLALLTLHETEELTVNERAYQSGVAYLLRTQEDDGSWLVPTRAIPLNGYIEGGSPHGKHQFISYAATCWATMALMVADRELR